jgi:putative transposase
VYLVAVIDLFTHKVVGWRQGHMQTSLVKDELTMAWFRRSEAGLILHSDPGSQYCSHEFKTALMHE